ncbi:MAG: phosphatidate cytidylyltransferase [Lachnospiraceae bacterium]|nr:phosphatidate cytidylyltransferase [Lachnospiraceae bacterium]
MLVRVLSGAVLVVLALVFLLLGGFWLGGAVLALSLVAFRELMHACKVEKDNKGGLLEYAGYAGIVLYEIVLFTTKDFSLGLGCLVLLFLMEMFIYVFTFPRYHALQVMPAFFCAFYACVPLSFVWMTRDLTFGVYLVWMIFISSWVCDTCAYFSGMALGKHKLAPILSPKKSVEGAIGGVIGSALVGGLFAWIFLYPESQNPNAIWLVALIGGAGAIISQVGDLSASAIKRNHEIKDYGKLIPGHGGVMDRFDSVLFTAPVIYFLSVLLLQVSHG